MCTHLFRRSSTYYFRRRIPKDVAAFYGGKLEVSFSLRTTSRIEAVRLARLAVVRLDGEFCRHRYGEPPEPSAVPLPVFAVRPEREPLRHTATSSLLIDVIDRWELEKQPAPKTASRTRAIVAEFMAVTNAPRTSDVKRQTILDYKDRLLANGQTPANINVKLGMIGVVFNYAKDNDLGLESNPASRIRVAEKRRAKEKRREFDDAALQAIFISPVYANGSRPRGGGGGACYWLPLLALFTGARIEELAQLRPEDVYEETYRDGAGQQHSAWVVRVTHSTADGQELKTAASERRIPIHAELIRLGFIERARAAAGKRRIFSSLMPDVYGVESGNFSKWFGRYLRTACRVSDDCMDFPRSDGQMGPSRRSYFKGLGTDATQMTVASGSIVKDFDVVEDIGACQVARLVDTFADTFLFQTAEKRLSNGIIPTIPPTTHAWHYRMRTAETLPIVASILASLIGVDNDFGRRLTPP